MEASRVAAPGRTVVGRIIEGRGQSSGTVRGQTGLLAPVEATATTEGTSTVALGDVEIETTFDTALRATTH